MLLDDKIKQLRKSEKITQKELADKFYVSRQTISNWENNKLYPSMDYIVSLSGTFNVSIDHLVKEDLEISREENKMVEQNSIQKNKFRVVLGRVLFIRFNFLWVGFFSLFIYILLKVF